MGKKISSVITNKYLLAAVFFVVWMLFFDMKDIFTQLEKRKELKQLEAQKKYYQEEIEKTKKDLSDLQNNPAALEKFARENYLMKKDNEDIFIVEDTNAIKNK